MSQPRDTNARRADSQRTSPCEPLIPKTTSLYPMLAKQDLSSHCCKSLRRCRDCESQFGLKQASTEDTADKFTQASMCGGPRAKQQRCGLKTRSLCRDPDSTRRFIQRSSFLSINQHFYLSQLSLSNIKCEKVRMTQTLTALHALTWL